MAYDARQQLLAFGTKSGGVRLYPLTLNFKRRRFTESNVIVPCYAVL